ncbi:hypothetical protein B0T25DRAFT_543080 [Lasiosphaeria hispida]|uniref:Apple domain-containing protein n=1 Tax=Lasiosphaeria hispida TaxID=260671 RepID=A0AAJ0HHP4_9PEZI|nr:hypothetical protein B0T25DRAFT_543080 [Lasiosphaeria hispida]
MRLCISLAALWGLALAIALPPALSGLHHPRSTSSLDIVAPTVNEAVVVTPSVNDPTYRQVVPSTLATSLSIRSLPSDVVEEVEGVIKTDPQCPQNNTATVEMDDGTLFVLECENDRWGYDIGLKPLATGILSWRECGNRCVRTPGCRAFAWHTNIHTCWGKYTIPTWYYPQITEVWSGVLKRYYLGENETNWHDTLANPADGCTAASSAVYSPASTTLTSPSPSSSTSSSTPSSSSTSSLTSTVSSSSSSSSTSSASITSPPSSVKTHNNNDPGSVSSEPPSITESSLITVSVWEKI